MLTATTGAVLADTSGVQYFLAFVALCYYAFAIWCAWVTIKKGHWLLFFLGLFFSGIFWLVGYFSVDKRAEEREGGHYYGGGPPL